MDNKLDFPAPLIPSNPKHCPFGIPSEVLFTATFAPECVGYTLVTPSIYRPSQALHTYSSNKEINKNRGENKLQR